jgi:bacterioferritin-associated ferredoxin
MIVCLCNPFSDKKVRQHLERNPDVCCRVSDVYTACTEGQKPQCHSCIPTLKDIVRSHNGKKAA